MPASWTSTSGRMPNLARMQRKAFESFQQGDLAKTERLCTGLLEHVPDDFDTLHLLGMVNFRRHRLAEALRLLGAALKANPVSSEAMSNLGLALHTAGHYDEAISRYRNALQLEPDQPEFLYNLGNSYLELGRYDEAVASYDAALAAKPDHVGALVNRGNTQLRLNAPLAALANYDAARGLMPRHPQILTNRGHTLRRLDRPAEALAEFSAAIKSAPDFAEAHFEAAMAHITLGDFDAGWKAYEWRWKAGAFARQRRSLQAPLWLGDRPVAGKTILLHAEQGFGDTIQFIRYAPLLARLGANVVCEVQGELRPLLAQLDDVQVVDAGAPLPAFDLHCPLLSLPLAFKTQLETIPASIPYLSAPADRLQRWRTRLPPGRPRAGFVWSGSATHKNDANRSLPLARLAPLLETLPLQCVSLQSELRSADRDVLRDLPNLVHLGDELGDFADTAAVISLLDVVVSVDTAVAHLAGALGKPVLLLLPHAADFRWMRQRTDTPWYPTATLLRQQAFGDWDSVIALLRDELGRFQH